MQTRGSYEMHWAYYVDLPIAAAFTVPPGGNFSGFDPANGADDMMPIQNARFFSIDVYTDDLVTVEIQVGATVATMATMVTLTCPAVLQHNTVYDLPPPFNTDGFLLVTGHLMRLRVNNNSGNVVSPFNLVAKVWN